MSNEPILIGITGNMGSGKTTFADLLRDAGQKVVSADQIAQRQLEEPNNIKAITRRWGKQAVKNGKPDRARIAEIVFADKSELDYLNNLVHPGTLTALQAIVDEANGGCIFFEVPLLFEAGMQECFDYVILVHTDPEVSIRRLVKTGKVTREQLLTRLEAQIDSSNKKPLCDLVIENNGSLASLKRTAREFLLRLDSIKSRNKIPFAG